MIQLPKDFDWKVYNYLNKDVNKGITDYKEIQKNSIQHYLNHGYYEKRYYKFENIPEDFDYKIYLKINYESLKTIIENYRNTQDKNELYLNVLNHYNTIGFNKLTYKLEDKFIINDGKTIIHITHNFNGGTNVYIQNLKDIYKSYNHLIINIISNDLIKINNKYYNIDNLNILNCKIMVVHHLLFINVKDFNHKLNKQILKKIKEINLPKILIVHDYCYLFPNCPNPIKNKNLIPNKSSIEKTKFFLNLFNKVFFNSINCFSNYIKHLKTIPNHHILNSVPDIHFYNTRIFPIKKPKYNIGIIGDIGCEHKGKFLANNIIQMFNNNNMEHTFVIFGNYDILYKNLIITGQYYNDDIFKLIYDYDIDYFLFLSVFEETYSFTLSIALHTGLPIIYNNIGSYPERLQNYKNCFPFEENNYEKIMDIFKYIETDPFIHFENKNLPYIYPPIYNCIPGLSNLIEKNPVFDINNINRNLLNKNICFINFVNINNGLKILNEQINYIKNSGLYDKLDYILIILLGPHIKLTLCDYKIKVIYESENNLEHELPAMKLVKQISDQLNFNVKILYIHVKGVLNKPHSYEWRKYLEYFLIQKHEICIKSLNNFFCVGVNQHFYFDEENKKRNHFSGNFWWANSNYIKSLSPIYKSKDRYAYEHWLIGDLSKVDYRYLLSLHHTHYDLYKKTILPNEYNLELIKHSIKLSLKNQFQKNRNIYGVYFICCAGNYFQIVKEQINLLLESGLYNESDKILCFICNLDMKKNYDILELLKDYKKCIIIPSSENLYEKFAINNFKTYIKNTSDYYIYYMHTKSISRKEKCYSDWRKLCDYFTINKWRLSIKLLQYYDCVGINFKNFPKKHFSGNYWWSKSEHINRLKNINDAYLSPEMYICSDFKTNYISLFQSNVTHGNTEFEPEKYIDISDEILIDNISNIPDFNEGDKIVITDCGPLEEGLHYS